MTPQEMQARSAEKVKQVLALMSMLNLRNEARERVNEGGFIEKMVFWIDDEKYLPPANIDPAVAGADTTVTGEAPTGPTA